MVTSSSVASMFEGPPVRQHQVFINFRGEELRNNFISHLVRALKDDDINYYIDRNEVPSQSIEILFDRIDESDIALAVFSKQYSESKWCLDELERIMKNVAERKLRVIPIFYNVTVDEVKNQKGEFGINFYNCHHGGTTKMVAWREALKSASKKMALILANFRSESDFIVKIVESVNEVIAIIEGRDGTNMLSRNISSVSSRGNASSRDIREPATLPWYRMEQCLEQLEEKLNFDCKETQIVGIVGMPGIGKTTLATRHFKKWNWRVFYSEIFQGFRQNSNYHDWVKNILVDAKRKEKCKVLIVLDDVSDKQQLEFLRMNPEETIQKGSKIMVTTRDRGSIEGLAHDTYVIPGLNDKEALELFTYYAFADHTPREEFEEMSKKFVDYAGGNPLALEELGKEICGTNEDHWQKSLETLPHRCNENIRRNLKISYDDLTEKQKHAFLDIACFFRSEEEDYVRVLLDSYDTNSGEAAREVRDLADKFLISISAGRIEMHNILCTMGKEISSSAENNLGKSRLWDFEDASRALISKEGTNHARGIFLDTSKIPNGISLKKTALIGMPNLRYVKIFDSRCPQQCEVVDRKVYLPEELELPLKEIRYLHWLKFPLEELPSDFTPENLIDLRLPYSKIKRVWEGIKRIPKLKWVDLSHSTDLIDLSALSNAESLRRLNLEGCTMLVELSGVVENMKSLAFLNLKGCTRLLSLPQMESLTSLKTLILSDCSNFKEFQVISENIEYLHLDGTAIQGLPPTIQNLGRLIVLNLKDCKKLESLPDCLDKLKALEELILSGCSMLSSFPEVNEIMENLQILLLDGTLIDDLPNLLLQCGNNSINLQWNQPRMNRLALLRRLCLRGNDKISSLQSSISQLYHLKEIDLKHCKNLESLPTLPPNLQCLDAHDCVSLKTVGIPLALLLPLTEQVPSSFIFTNCENLEHAAKNEIISYAHNKSRLISDALNRHNKGLSFEALVSTCFPGSEVPTWFNHRASGAVLEPERPGHWSERGFVGIALCAIVSFQDYKVQNNNLMVECNCECNNSSSFNCNVGGLSELSDKQSTIKSTHVFLRYTSWLNMNKFSEEVRKKGCLGPTEASIKFKVTDGTCEAENCEVLKCGFSLVCESDNGSWDANIDASPMVSESDNGSLDAYVDASPMVSESDHGSLDAYVDASESFHGCSDAYTDENPMVSESDHGSLDANIDATPVAKEVRKRESRILGNWRRRLPF